LKYVIRKRSEEFLSTLDSNLAKDNIDFFHIYNAFQTIGKWFENNNADKVLKAINLYKYFGENIKVIWYEVDKNADAVALFTRLNIGKIPLTNAELVKALFLSRDTDGLTEEKQLEIATSWDMIEHELHNNDLWAFLTNESSEKYATRIELLFNMMANKDENEKDGYFTFFYFTERVKTESKKEIWKKIQEFFLKLKGWYERRDIFHKVGYLVAIGEKMQDIISQSSGLTKNAFDDYLNRKIIDKLQLTKENILDLNYRNTSDRFLIEKILLLFNVETVRLLQNTSEKFSFERHKRKQWSLEHIHAQNSEGLNVQKDQQKWLTLHRRSLEDLLNNTDNKVQVREVIQRIDDNIENITKVNFDLIFAEVFKLFSENDDRSYMDSIANLALLSTSDNAALNNSTFDVKRNKIIEMDRLGEYIPICTRRIFLKYYTESKDNQLQFWGDADRKSYLDAMIGDQGVLINYLEKPIVIE
jgi:hypothetical protein